MSDRILVATRKGLFTLKRNGAASSSWKIARADFLADHVSMVLADARDNRIYAGLDHGHFGVKMHRSDAEGAWEECAAPVYPEKPEGETDTDNWGKPIPWTTAKIWALEAGGSQEPGVLWCGTIPGGLLVQCRVDPDRLWVQHHNGIFRSDDGGRRWREVTEAGPSTFGFAVAVHPRDPDTAWFIPALKDEKRIPVDGKVVVTRTRDGGKTFATLREGLPQEHAYDLVFRHALDIDATGDRLAFGSTTGALWVSENQGDRWQCVSQHLPPIYCVRFA